MKKYTNLVFSFFIIFSCLISFDCSALFWKKKGTGRPVTILNDISGLISVFPDETQELEDAITYYIEVNGVPINDNELKMVPIYNNRCVVSVRSKKRWHEHVDTIQKKYKRLIEWSLSWRKWIDVYYTFDCLVSSSTNFLSLGPVVLHACKALNDGKPYSLSYKMPLGVHIWLREPVACD